MNELLRLADAQIIDIQVGPAVAVIRLKDWQEQDIRIELSEVIGVEIFAFASRDLSHVNWTDDHPLVKTALEHSDDDPADALRFKCLSFFSAETSTSVLNVVAEHYVVIRPSA